MTIAHNRLFEREKQKKQKDVRLRGNIVHYRARIYDTTLLFSFFFFTRTKYYCTTSQPVYGVRDVNCSVSSTTYFFRYYYYCTVSHTWSREIASSIFRRGIASCSHTARAQCYCATRHSRSTARPQGGKPVGRV